MKSSYFIPTLGTLFLALVFRPEWIWLVFITSVVAAAILVGLSALIAVYVNYSKPMLDNYRKPTPELEAMRKYLADIEPKPEKPLRLPVIFGRMVDGILQQLMDLALRDYVGRLFAELGFKSHELIQDMKVDIWKVIQNLQERLSKVDQTKLIAVDLVNKVTLHFERIRLVQSNVVVDCAAVEYKLSPHLTSPEREREYLRKLSEHSIELLFPPSYSAANPVKHLLREILVCKIFYPAIELLTDPDYINQKILAYIKQQPQVEAMRRKSYAQAANYQDFIQMIKDSIDPEELKHIRYSIVTEIFQATTVHSMKKSKGLDAEKAIISQGKRKGEMLQARQLKRYINQLTYAKSQCEKRLRILDGSPCPVEEAVEASMFALPMLPLSFVLENVICRSYLSQFLETMESKSLIGYWTSVEELRQSNKCNWHQLGAEVFYTYINTPAPDIKVDKPVLKRMDGFLLGDSGPEVFYEVQDQVVRTLEEKLYPAFLTSELYQEMQTALEEANKNDDDGTGDQQMLDDVSSSSGISKLDAVDQSNYAGYKLDTLQEKLDNKVQALEALRESLKPESRVLTVLEKEVEKLQGERRQLEAHLSRTEVWGEHLGQWRAAVQSAELSEDKEVPQFVLVVHILEDESDGDAVSTGWVVLRKLSDFQELHRKLCQLSSVVKHLELPSQSLKFRFGKSSVKSALDKAKIQIQKYLKFVLEDERLNQSEALYTFLSPSSEHLKHVALPSPKKFRFSLTTLFKSAVPINFELSRESTSSVGSKESDEEDVTLLLDEGEGRTPVLEGGGIDGIAEPLYSLLSEIFDLRGVFKWLRKTLITFVQITYNRTINRQVYETVEWIFSEQMIYYYIKLFIKSWWPNGKLMDSPPRTVEEKTNTKCEAREQVLHNIPEVLSNLVGQQSARRGATKVFETLQDPKLNKQLFYDLVEVIVYELCPELKIPSDASAGEAVVSSST